MSTQDSALASIFEGLRSSHAQEVWAEFLSQYSPLIFQTCQYATSDEDQAADCFLFACEQLSRNDFRRLLRFRVGGPAAFSTWLRVVVRNLCLDWRRREFGRPRLFRCILRLSQLGIEVYRCRYEQALSREDTFASLRLSFPGLTMTQLAAAEEQVQESLSSQQLWRISTQKPQLQMQSQESSIGIIEAPVDEPADPRPNQELVFGARELQERLHAAVGKLPPNERLLLRMRFEQGLSLEEIAGLTGLGDAQRVYRRVSEIIEKLRKKVG